MVYVRVCAIVGGPVVVVVSLCRPGAMRPPVAGGARTVLVQGLPSSPSTKKLESPPVVSARVTRCKWRVAMGMDDCESRMGPQMDVCPRPIHMHRTNAATHRRRR